MATILNITEREERNKKIVDMIISGYLTKDITKEIGIDRNIIHKVAKKNNLKLWRGKLNRFQEAELIADYINKMPLAGIYEKYDISDQVVWNTLDRYEIERTRRVYHDDLNEEFVIMDYLSGMLVDEIMEKFNISRCKFFTVLKENGIPVNRNNRLPEEDRRKIADRYAAGERVRDIMESYPEYLATRFVYDSIAEFGIPIRPARAIPESEYEKIKNLYIEGYSTIEIGNMYEVSSSTIGKILKDLAVETRDPSHAGRDYDINENYFEKIDTSQKAYWLGFIAADGCSTPSQNKIQITLQAGDRSHLAKFLKDIGSDHPVRDFIKGGDGIGAGNAYANIAFCNKKMNDDLEKLGIVHRKTYDMHWPDIEDRFISHYLRGVFDGDGCLCITNQKKFYFNIAGLKEFLPAIAYHINRLVGVNCIINPSYSHPESAAGNLWVCGNRQIMKMLNFLFKDHGGDYLERKYELYKQSIEHYKQIRGHEQIMEFLNVH